MADNDKKAQPAGAPAWMATFADLMSLLMCFFVLLLAFSEMDVLKYKQVAGSMREAFGVQRDIFAKENPMGTSFVAQEYSPGRPDPTPVKRLQEQTSDTMEQYLKVDQPGNPDNVDGGVDADKKRGSANLEGEQSKDGMPSTKKLSDLEREMLEKKLAEEKMKQAEELAEALQFVLDEETYKGLLEIETEEAKVIIRIQEKGSFDSGSSRLKNPITPVIRKIGLTLEGTPGLINIVGHTDDIPIRSGRYSSNWELSASRAAIFAEKLLYESELEATRITVQGLADTKPLVPNNSAANRAKNRRVEIIVEQGEDTYSDLFE